MTGDPVVRFLDDCYFCALVLLMTGFPVDISLYMTGILVGFSVGDLLIQKKLES